MTLAFVLGVLFLSTMIGLVRLRYGWSLRRWLRSIRFEPAEELTPAQVFACLLSANIALLEHDNFNQLASALPARRVRKLLASHWGIDSVERCSDAIIGRLSHLGGATADEDAAFAAWAVGARLQSESWIALRDVCYFLAADAEVVRARQVIRHRFSMMAWDIQQVAYIARLGCKAGFVSRETAERVLDLLQRRARLTYDSWHEYSLSMLVGMGMRSPVDSFDLGGWYEFARSHTVLVESRNALLRHASPWGGVDAGQPASAASMSRAIEAGVSSGA